MHKKSLGMKIFTIFNYTFLTLLALTCLLPMINQLAISFSSSSAVAAGDVGLFPVDFTLDSYKYMADKPEFWKSLMVSLKRILIAVPFS
ncbi:MAG: carbohydrate ABC transporter permease, partial [Lachnospiraceae bacterium]|nr:carbohydrate ABC transporter permease [Lachnospiraceae bacterium]